MGGAEHAHGVLGAGWGVTTSAFGGAQGCFNRLGNGVQKNFLWIWYGMNSCSYYLMDYFFSYQTKKAPLLVTNTFQWLAGFSDLKRLFLDPIQDLGRGWSLTDLGLPNLRGFRVVMILIVSHIHSISIHISYMSPTVLILLRFFFPQKWFIGEHLCRNKKRKSWKSWEWRRRNKNTHSFATDWCCLRVDVWRSGHLAWKKQHPMPLH